MSGFKMNEHFGSKIGLVIDGAGYCINQIHYYNKKKKCGATDELHCSNETAQYIHYAICSHDPLVEKVAQLEADKAELLSGLGRISEWNELSIKRRADIGSNGQRDYYRCIASKLLQKHKG